MYSELKRLVVRIPAVKSPLYLTETCQVVICLMCFGTGMLVFCLIKKLKKIGITLKAMGFKWEYYQMSNAQGALSGEQ